MSTPTDFPSDTSVHLHQQGPTTANEQHSVVASSINLHQQGPTHAQFSEESRTCVPLSRRDLKRGMNLKMHFQFQAINNLPNILLRKRNEAEHEYSTMTLTYIAAAKKIPHNISGCTQRNRAIYSYNPSDWRNDGSFILCNL